MSNTLTAVIDKLLAEGLRALRQQAVMPRLVNRRYELLGGQKGSTVDIPIPSAIAVQAVAPAATPPATADIAPTSVAVALNKWYEAPFYLTDQEFTQVQNDTIPMQASEAVKALANQVDADLLALYKDVYGFAGTPGTTPFQTDLTEFVDARNVLNKQLAPMDPRYAVLSPDAEAKAILLRAFQDASFRGDPAGIINGQIGQKLGALWLMDQNIPTHTAGTGAGYLINNVAGYNAGDKTVAVDTGAGTILVGDVVTFAGVSGTYVVTTALGGGSFSFEPGLAGALADNAAVTVKASHVVNLAFHRDAFALVSRPLEASDPAGLGRFAVAVDEVSGLVLRLEVSREHKRTRFSYDILYGVKTVRRELAARIAG